VIDPPPPAPDAMLLAEFAALRAEILQRTAQQQALIALDLTAIASLTGFVISGHAPNQLLLVAAIVSSVLGMLWLDHDRSIAGSGRYIQEHLWKWTPSWEKHLRTELRSGTWHWIYWAAILVIFLGTSTASLAIGWPGSHGSTGYWTLWFGGTSLTLAFAAMYGQAIRK
jgi:hypothetical protein